MQIQELIRQLQEIAKEHPTATVELEDNEYYDPVDYIVYHNFDDTVVIY